MKAIYAAVLFIILFTSCKKDYGTTTVEGKVLDATTGAAVPYAKVLLQKGSELSGSIGTKQEFAADAAGNFSFSFEAEKGKVYEANGYKDDAYFKAITAYNIENGRKNKDVQVKLQPAGWLRFHLHDEAPLGNVSRFLVHPFISPQNIQIFNPSIDTTFKVMTFGNITNQYFYFLTIDGVEYTIEGKIYTKALDTTDVFIKF